MSNTHLENMEKSRFWKTLYEFGVVIKVFLAALTLFKSIKHLKYTILLSG